jgi:glycosyltransferase domain-containing protein
VAKTYQNILVLDSSASEVKIHNAKTIALISSKIKYIEFDTTIRPDSKIYQGLLTVLTKYFVLCADDDLLFVDGVRQAVEFLSNNSDFMSVDGIYLNFLETDRSVEIGVEYGAQSLQEDLPLERIFNLMKSYESLFYAVCRTNDVLPIYQNMEKIESLHFLELFQSVATILLGKTRRIPVFYAARNRGQPAEPERENWQTHAWFVSDSGGFIRHYDEYRKELYEFAKLNVKVNMPNEQDFKRVMDLSHALFFSKNYSAGYLVDELRKDGLYSLTVNADVDAISALKGPRRIKTELRIKRLADLLIKLANSYASPWQLLLWNLFGKKIGKSNANFKIVMSYSWLAGVPKFTDVCQELSRFLNIKPNDVSKIN